MLYITTINDSQINYSLENIKHIPNNLWSPKGNFVPRDIKYNEIIFKVRIYSIYSKLNIFKVLE